MTQRCELCSIRGLHYWVWIPIEDSRRSGSQQLSRAGMSLMRMYYELSNWSHHVLNIFSTACVLIFTKVSRFLSNLHTIGFIRINTAQYLLRKSIPTDFETLSGMLMNNIIHIHYGQATEAARFRRGFHRLLIHTRERINEKQANT